MLGWVLREYMFYHHDRPNINPPSHPEMYDENGNIIPESLIAFRFDNLVDDDDDDDLLLKLSWLNYHQNQRFMKS